MTLEEPGSESAADFKRVGKVISASSEAGLARSVLSMAWHCQTHQDVADGLVVIFKAGIWYVLIAI